MRSCAGHACGDVQLEEFVPDAGAIRFVARGTGADGGDLVRAHATEHIFSLEHLRTRAGLRALANIGRRIVQPRPITHHEVGDLTQRVRKGRVSPFHTKNCPSMHLANNIVGALLAFRRRVAICVVVAGQGLITKATVEELRCFGALFCNGPKSHARVASLFFAVLGFRAVIIIRYEPPMGWLPTLLQNQSPDVVC